MAAPSIPTIKRLFLRTGNRCAFPGCDCSLVDESQQLLAEVCHICAERPGGKRYDPTQSESDRQGCENLIVLCPNHHTIVDGDEITYSVDVLRDMKRRHEAKALSDYVIGDPLAKRVAILLGGVTIGTQLAGIVHGIGSVAKTIVQSMASPESGENSFRHDLIGTLRYAPKGVLRYALSRPTQTRVGLFFVGIFKDAGWQIEKISDESFAQAERSSKPSAVLIFTMKNHYKIPNARQAIFEVFRKASFSIVPEADKFKAVSQEDGIMLLVVIGADR